MGGVITVAIRFQDGSTVIQKRNTNPLSWWMRNMRLVRKDESLLREYLENAPSWASPADLAPEEYGLVVIDLVGDRLFERNDYSRIGRLLSTTAAADELDAADHARLKAFVDDGRVSVVHTWTMEDVPAADSDLPSIGTVVDWDYFGATIRKDWSGPHGRNVMFQFDFSPLQYANYDGRPESMRALRKDLADAGFDASSALWEEHVHDEGEEADI